MFDFAGMKNLMVAIPKSRQSIAEHANVKKREIGIISSVAVLIFSLSSARAIETPPRPEQSAPSQLEVKGAKPVELPNQTISSEQGIESAETGVNFLPDESGVACFTKLGRFNTDDRGIHIIYRRRKPDIYINSEFDPHENKYHIVFGNTYCRYTVTVQREVKISGQWKLSTMAD